MRKWIWIFGILFFVSPANAAWDKTKPADDEYKYLVPGVIRANWDAIELGTDANLQITNAKVASSAAIVDTKLAQITTASKVSGTAITGLASTPAGAGALPVANGGTGSTSASAARTALGVAALGANSDITSMTGLTTPLAVAYGGTGSATQNFIGLTGDQTVAGVKTFSSFPVTPSSAPTTDYQVANKKYVVDSVAAAPGGQADGTQLWSSNDTQRSTTNGTYQKLKETTVNFTGTLTVKFDLAGQYQSSISYGRIYVNDVAVGTERTVGAGSGDIFQTFSESITLTSGDKLQVYGRTEYPTSHACYVKNLRIYSNIGSYSVNASY